MTETQTLEIVNVLKSLPSEKVIEVKDFALFLREKYRNDEIIDESDEWSDEDLIEAVGASILYSEVAK